MNPIRIAKNWISYRRTLNELGGLSNQALTLALPATTFATLLHALSVNQSVFRWMTSRRTLDGKSKGYGAIWRRFLFVLPIGSLPSP